MKKINVLSLFGGIECGRVAMERLGWELGTYYSSEFDKYPQSQTEKNFPDIIHLGDVRSVKPSELERIDILIGGSPCQDLSNAKANGKGLEGEKSSLFFEYVRILEECKPKYFLLENVASMKKVDRDKITEIMGVEPIFINSALVSAQNRKRLYWTNIPGVTQPEDRGIVLRDILEDIPSDDPRWKPLDEKYIQKDFIERYEKIREIACMTEARSEEGKRIRRESMCTDGRDFCPRRGKTLLPRTDGKSNCLTAGIGREHMIVGQFCRRCESGHSVRIHTEQEKSPALLANMGTGGSNIPIMFGMALRNRGEGKKPEFNESEKANSLTTVQTDSVVSDGFFWRTFTPIECERLQTLPDNFTKDLSNSRRYKAIGNGWTVDVIAHILSYCKFEEEQTQPTEKTRNEKLQHLHKCMLRYQNITGEDMAKLKADLYRRNKVASRAELTDIQLDEEITFFVTV